jgi:hypothetical protein
LGGWSVRSSPRPIAAGWRRNAEAVPACSVPSPFLCWAAIEGSFAEREHSAGTAHEKTYPRIGGSFDARARNSVGPGAWWRCGLGRDIGRCGVRPGGRGCGRANWIYRWTSDRSFLGNERIRIEESLSDEIPRRDISKSRQPGCAGDDRERAASRNSADFGSACSPAISRTAKRNAARSRP